MSTTRSKSCKRRRRQSSVNRSRTQRKRKPSSRIEKRRLLDFILDGETRTQTSKGNILEQFAGTVLYLRHENPSMIWQYALYTIFNRSGKIKRTGNIVDYVFDRKLCYEVKWGNIHHAKVESQLVKQAEALERNSCLDQEKELRLLVLKYNRGMELMADNLGVQFNTIRDMINESPSLGFDMRQLCTLIEGNDMSSEQRNRHAIFLYNTNIMAQNAKDIAPCLDYLNRNWKNFYGEAAKKFFKQHGHNYEQVIPELKCFYHNPDGELEQEYIQCCYRRLSYADHMRLLWWWKKMDLDEGDFDPTDVNQLDKIADFKATQQIKKRRRK